MSLALLQAAGAEAVQSVAEARWHVVADLFLADPWFLLLAPLGWLALAFGRARAAREAGRVGVLPDVPLPRTLAQRLAFAPIVLECAAFALVAVALARPVRANELRTNTSEGVDIVLAIDRSGSMQFLDLDPEKSRLEVVKEVVSEFAVRRMSDRVGAADSCALLVFARYPQLLCPFTLDAGALTGFLRGVELVRYDAEDGTAIGRGLAKAVAALSGNGAKSKVVVLLTDGENNVDDILPDAAAELAAEKGVRVYTVLAAKYAYVQTMFGRVEPSNKEIDTKDLEAIAKRTGGRFFRVRDRKALEDVYKEIERLERTPRTEERRVETFDLYPRALHAALAAYALAWLCYATWARRIL
ncbi:MAG TPA: VWA domain-containing protein [Planctomycetota bacterium]|nr:VWA domain-containing protein [Planctomycetota bacterium]